MFWVDGESQQTVDILDRSFQYGDGCFTTMLVQEGQVQHFYDINVVSTNALKRYVFQHLIGMLLAFGSIMHFNISKITIFMEQRAFMVQRSSMIQTSLIIKKLG